jgi:hypothetical protein
VRQLTRSQLTEAYQNHTLCFHIGHAGQLATNKTTGHWWYATNREASVFYGPYLTKSQALMAWSRRDHIA